MPCFHGLAVSIHTTGPQGGPLAEFGIQKQSKFHRITSYVPVPNPKLLPGTTKPEPATFAISITLLTPGLPVPYSQPNPTPEDPHPRPKIVGRNEDGGYRGGGASGIGSRGAGWIAPYTPVSQSVNETIAAYIYFDGRPKEEVATLLRRGEETWVNSRWVSIPESEGGGLAEKEFIFREVGLERWLNGLDLEGKDAKAAAATVEKRRQRFERKRRIKRELMDSDDDEGMDDVTRSRRRQKEKEENNGVLRYGEDRNAPVQSLSDSDNDSDALADGADSDDEPMPEAAGQIKVALFRVLASGEVKRGEYSPQFDVHDDEEQMGNGGEGNGEEIDHTTSFAKPKTLDPKTISTQTVTGIDPPDKPYAVFTFLYRGPKQLQKMGLMPTSPRPEKATLPSAKRKSGMGGIDFGSLAPLSQQSQTKKPTINEPRKANSRERNENDMDDSASEDEDEDRRPRIKEEDDEKDMSRTFLTAEEVLEESKLSDELRKTKLKRAHSAEPLNAPSPQKRVEDGDSKFSPASLTPTSADTPNSGAVQANGGAVSQQSADGSLMPPPTSAPSAVPDLGTDASVASPFKKQRSSLPGIDSEVRRKLALEGAAGPRRESESAIASTTSALANATGTSKPESKALFEPGMALGSNVGPSGGEMEEEEL